ncbi:MAG: siderophore-interacting protein [Bacteroidota bacterium]
MTNRELPIIQDVFTVKSKEFITPHYVRITLTGNVELFKNATLGDNNKIFIPPKNVDTVHMRSYDFEKEEWVLPPEHLRPIMRTYTHRAIDLTKKELVIDFVNHGLNGPASCWANAAQKGSQLGIAMKSKPKELYPEKDWYLLVGDATAIPVISIILESLPSSANGICIIEVHGYEDEQILHSKAAIQFKWLHNPFPEKGSKLIEEVRKVSMPQTSKFGYVACEFDSVKQIRQYLRKEKNWRLDELYAYSYWKNGLAEDESASSRRKHKRSDRHSGG